MKLHKAYNNLLKAARENFGYQMTCIQYFDDFDFDTTDVTKLHDAKQVICNWVEAVQEIEPLAEYVNSMMCGIAKQRDEHIDIMHKLMEKVNQLDQNQSKIQ